MTEEDDRALARQENIALGDEPRSGRLRHGDIRMMDERRSGEPQGGPYRRIRLAFRMLGRGRYRAPRSSGAARDQEEA
jgi:hypothetical protein